MILAYNDGAGINYNPNTIIDMLDSIVDDIFVTEGKSKEKAAVPILNESGGTGSGAQTFRIEDTVPAKGGLFSNMFGGNK